MSSEPIKKVMRPRQPLPPAAEPKAEGPPTVPFAAAGGATTPAPPSEPDRPVDAEPTPEPMPRFKQFREDYIDHFRSKQQRGILTAVDRIAVANATAEGFLLELQDASQAALAKTTDPGKKCEMLATTVEVIGPIIRQIVAGSAKEIEIRKEVNQPAYAPRPSEC